MQDDSKAMSTNVSSRKTEKSPDSSRTAKVWIQLSEMFGKGFFRENGDTAPNLWNVAIARLTDAEISKGLVNLGNDDLTFPPNLSMFVSACRRPEPVRALGAPQIELNDEQRREDADKAWAYMERLAGRKLRP